MYTIRVTKAPKGHVIPPLLRDFAAWLKTKEHGELGWFDSLAVEEIAMAEDAWERLREAGFVFLTLPDGSALALVRSASTSPPAVVLLGSEGEKRTVANSLEAFLQAWAKGKTQIDELDDNEQGNAGRKALAKWLREKEIKPPKAPAFDFEAWLENGSGAVASSKRVRPPKRKEAITYLELRALLGKSVDDAEVKALLARADKAEIDSEIDFIVSKGGGFEFALKEPPGSGPGKNLLLATLFVYPDGKVLDQPAHFALRTRAELRATLGKPLAGDDYLDRWLIDGFDVGACYREDAPSHFIVSPPEEAMGGRDLSTNPMHLVATPIDAPAHAELVGMALLVAWAANRFGLPPKHAGSELGSRLLKRTATPLEFLINACGSTLTTLDVDAPLRDFLHGYTQRTFKRSDDGARQAADAVVKELLHLQRKDTDEFAFADDFLGTFASVVESPFHVPGTWQAVERIAPVLDARFADFEATAFRTPPDLAPYEQAAKQRDAHLVDAVRAKVTQPTLEPGLTTELLSIVRQPLADKRVKDVLKRASLPVGKRVDEQANPLVGISYMGAEIKKGGKKTLGIEYLSFHATKHQAFIRGIGHDVEFDSYPLPLPHGLAFGATRKALAAALGQPTKGREVRLSNETYWEDEWKRAGTYPIVAKFIEDKLVMLQLGVSLP